MNNKNEMPARMLLNPQPGRETTMQFVVALLPIPPRIIFFFST